VLLATYTALLLALFVLTAFVPGVPFQSSRTIGGTVVLDALVLYFLWRGSRAAWYVAAILSAVGVPLYAGSMLSPHGELSFNLKGLVALLLEAAALFVLTAPGLQPASQRSPALPEARI
jgi:hypothetical protein